MAQRSALRSSAGETGQLSQPPSSDEPHTGAQGQNNESDGLDQLLRGLQRLAGFLWGRFIDRADMGTLDRAIMVEERAVFLTPDGHPGKPTFLSNLGAYLKSRFDRLGEIPDIDRSIEVQQRAVYLANAIIASHLSNLGISLQSRFDRLGEIQDINNAIEVHQQAVLLTQDGDADKPRWLNNLGISLRKRFDRLGQMRDIDGAIEVQQQAVSLTPDDHEDKPGRLNDLGAFLQNRFNHVGEMRDIERAIKVQQQAVSLTPYGHASKPTRLSNLRTVESQFERLEGMSGTDKAIEVQKRAVSLLPDSTSLSNLGRSLQRRFDRLGEIRDIDTAIEVMQQAITLTPDGHPNNPALLDSLGISLQSRFERLGRMPDIHEAIKVQQKAVSLIPDGHELKPMLLNNLGISLGKRFDRLGEMRDINKAIEVQKQAVSLIPGGHTSEYTSFGNLGTSLSKRFERLGEMRDLERAIEVQQEVVSLLPDGHANKPTQLNNLGTSLLKRFNRLGEMRNIDRAIEIQQQAVSLTLDDHPGKPTFLENLALSLGMRFRRLEEMRDIDRAIDAQHQAVSLTPSDHADKPMRLNNLGLTLQQRFDKLGEMQDINRAIVAQQRAVSLTYDNHADKPTQLNNLGLSLRSRFGRLRDIGDINKAIEVQQQAVSLAPDGHTGKPDWLHNLGISLGERFHRLGEVGDINKAIEVHHQAVSLTPDNHANGPIQLIRFGTSLLGRFKLRGDISDLDMAINLFQKSAQSLTGDPWHRLLASQLWLAALEMKEQDSTLPACQMLISLLPQIIWLGMPVHARYNFIKEKIGNSVNEAAAEAIEANEYELAVEWMEQGRSIIWGQLLHLRSPLDDLHAVHPRLADDLAMVSQLLESASFRGTQLDTLGVDLSLLEQQGQDHRRTAERRENLLDEIRKQLGFEQFLKPEKFAILSKAASNHPVVLINASRRRCDALVLSPSHPVILIPLPDFSVDKGLRLHSQLTTFLDVNYVRFRNPDWKSSNSTQENPEASFWSLLADLWALVVQPILHRIEHILGDNPTNVLPRITWCPTGPLSFLPLHAAGIYGSSHPSKVFDFVVSSYTPTLKALLQKKKLTSGKSPTVLVVTQPVGSDGYISLPDTLKEAKAIETTTAQYHLQTKHLSAEQATVPVVLDRIAHYDWVHLACHGIQDLTEPMETAFILHEGSLHLRALMATSLDHVQLAFLSACQTAVGNRGVPEESVHLTSAMLNAGFPSVVGTMWAIRDSDAPTVARAFYRCICKKGSESDWKEPPDTAYALHEAVQRLRKKVGEDKFDRWVPFVHFGS